MADYRVGIELILKNNISSALGVITADMLGLQRLQGRLISGFNQLQNSWLGLTRAQRLFVGGMSAAAGAGVLAGVKHFENAAEKLAHAQTTLLAGLPTMRDGHPVDRMIDLQIAKTAAYNEAGKNLNTTLSENIEHLHDLYNVVQDMPEAAKLLPAFNKLSNAFAFVKDEGARSIGSDSRQIAMAARAFELTGRTTPEAMDNILKGYVQSVIALRGRVTPNMLLGAVQTAGAGRYGWSNEFVSQGLPALLNVMGPRAGTALYHMYNNLYGGVASSYAQGLLQEKWGLHTKDQEVRDPIFKKFQGFKVGSVWNAQLLAADPQKWALSYRDFLHDTMHVNTDSLEVMRNVVGEIGRGNKQLGQILDEYLLPNPSRQLQKERRNIEGVGDDATGILNEDDPRAWHDKASRQWDNLKESLGIGLVKPFVEGVLKPLTLALRDMSQWAIHHPDTVTQLMKGITAFGGFLVAGGVGLILSALGPGGWLVLGIAGLGGALVGLSATKFGGEAFDLLTGGIRGLADALKLAWNGDWERLGEKIGRGLVDIPTKLIPAAFEMAVSIGKVLYDAILTIPPKIVDAAVQMVDGIVKGVRESIFGKEAPAGYTVSGDEMRAFSRRHPGVYPGTQKYWETLGHDFVDRRVRAFRAHDFVEKLIERKSLLRVPATAIQPQLMPPGKIDLMIPADRLVPKVKTIAERFGGGEQAGAVNKTENKTVNNHVTNNTTVNVNVANSNQAPAAVGQAVSTVVNAKVRGAIHDSMQ